MVEIASRSAGPTLGALGDIHQIAIDILHVISIYNGFILSHIFFNILVLLVGSFLNVDHPMVAPFRLMCNWQIDG